MQFNINMTFIVTNLTTLSIKQCSITGLIEDHHYNSYPFLVKLTSIEFEGESTAEIYYKDDIRSERFDSEKYYCSVYLIIKSQ